MEHENESARQPPRLHRVLPVAHQLPDGTWIISVEVWADHVVLRWAKPAGARASRYIDYADDYAPAEPPFGWGDTPPSPSRGWQLSDDLGTDYAAGGGGASGSESGFRGEVEFEPAPPAAATSIQIGHEALDQEVVVSLID